MRRAGLAITVTLIGLLVCSPDATARASAPTSDSDRLRPRPDVVVNDECEGPARVRLSIKRHEGDRKSVIRLAVHEAMAGNSWQAHLGASHRTSPDTVSGIAFIMPVRADRHGVWFLRMRPSWHDRTRISAKAESRAGNVCDLRVVTRI